MHENKNTFFARLEPRLSPSEVTWVRAAYIFAKWGHRAQKRKELDENGNPIRYFEHVRRTAIILMDEFNIYDPELIAAALLHDCLEDTEDVTAPLIEHMFGSRVVRIVRNLTNQPKEGYYARLAQAENDVLFVKFCDRLDNVRTFSAGGTAFARRKASETLTIYVPQVFSRLSGDPRFQQSLLKEMEDKCEQYFSQ